MSITGHTIQNAGTPGLYADVTGSNFTPGTNIMIFSLNRAGGSRNQNWRFISVDSDQNLYKIQSVLTGGYASVDSAAANQVVKTSLTSVVWQVTVVDTYSPNFVIKLPNTDLVWSVPTGSKDRTKITITAQSASNATQQWKLTNV